MTCLKHDCGERAVGRVGFSGRAENWAEVELEVRRCSPRELFVGGPPPSGAESLHPAPPGVTPPIINHQLPGALHLLAWSQLQQDSSPRSYHSRISSHLHQAQGTSSTAEAVFLSPLLRCDHLPSASLSRPSKLATRPLALAIVIHHGSLSGGALRRVCQRKYHRRQSQSAHRSTTQCRQSTVSPHRCRINRLHL